MSPNPHHSNRRAAGAPHARSLVGAALLAAAAIVAIPGLSSLAAAQTDPRQRVMYVTAVDSSGAPVAGLTPDDFIVREDGVRREVLRVEPATEPIEITLVVDNSAAAEPHLADMRRALADFVADMAKGNHIGIVTVGGRPQTLQMYTPNAAMLNRAVSRLFADETAGAYLLEGLSTIAGQLVKRAPERAAIIAIVVEGGPEFSNEPYQSLVKALGDCGATFDAVVLTPAPASEPAADRSAANHDRDVVLDQATRDTGGVNRQALSGMALAPELKTLAAQLRGQYRVVYARPESLIPPQKIEVGTRKPALTVRGTPVRTRR